jgi:hypothetical protein
VLSLRCTVNYRWCFASQRLMNPILVVVLSTGLKFSLKVVCMPKKGCDPGIHPNRSNQSFNEHRALAYPDTDSTLLTKRPYGRTHPRASRDKRHGWRECRRAAGSGPYLSTSRNSWRLRCGYVMQFHADRGPVGKSFPVLGIRFIGAWRIV